jgi:hypothetical protein
MRGEFFGLIRPVLMGLMLVLCWQPSVSLAAAPPQALKPAIQSYNARQYRQAIMQLKAMSGADANNPYTHYYLALSYQGLRQYAAAEQEYKWNYERSLDKDLRYKSWQGLQGLLATKVTSIAAASDKSDPAGAVGTGSNPAAANLVTNSNRVSNSPAATLKSSKFIFDGSTRGRVSTPFQMEWRPGCSRHR